MTDLATKTGWRAPRASFAETTPAVLRYQDGRRVRATLKVVSVTGGLLSVSKPLDQGCPVKLMFLILGGSVLGAAEMLSPVTWGLQPFKFVKLDEDNEERLRTAIQTTVDQTRHDHWQTERFRAW
jgi:hypothetical protein